MPRISETGVAGVAAAAAAGAAPFFGTGFVALDFGGVAGVVCARPSGAAGIKSHTKIERHASARILSLQPAAWFLRIRFSLAV